MAHPEARLDNTVARSMKAKVDDLHDFHPSHGQFKSILANVIRMKTEDAMNSLRRRLSPYVLVNDAMCPYVSLYETLIELMTAFNIQVVDGPTLEPVERCISALYTDTSLKPRLDKAMERLDAIREGTARGANVTTASIQAVNTATAPVTNNRIDTPMNNEIAKSKQSQAASYAFKDDSRRFSGQIGGQTSFSQLRREYEQVMMEHSIDQRSQVAFLHHTLDNPAREFFFTNIIEKASTLSQAFDILTKRFDNELTRAQSRARLDDLTIDSIKKEYSCGTVRALEIAYNLIMTIQPQCGSAFQADEHRTSWLSNALRHEEWSKLVRAQLLTTGLNSSQFYTMLLSTAQQLAEDETHTNENKKLSTTRPAAAEEMALINFANQLARDKKWRNQNLNHKGRFRHGTKHRSNEELRRIKSNTRCLKCGMMGHWRAECPNNDLTLSDAISSRLSRSGSNSKALRNMLVELVHDEDAYQTYLTQSALTELFHTTSNEADDEEEIDSILSELAIDPFDMLYNSLSSSNKESPSTQDEESETDGKAQPHSINLICQHTSVPSISRALDSPIKNSLIYNNWLTTVYSVPTHKLFRASSQKFLGALIDTGAQKSVIGLPQAVAYIRNVNPSGKLSPSHTRFRFGSTILNSLGSITIIFPTPTGNITECVYVVKCDIPLLASLEFLDKNHLQPLTLYNQLESGKHRWRIPLMRRDGHIFWYWSDTASTHYNVGELRSMHKNFAHSNARKLYNILKRAHDGSPPNTLAEIEAISAECVQCREYSPKAMAFRVREADRVVFNHMILLDVMFLESSHAQKKRPLLHIVDSGTRFNAAVFLPIPANAANVWNSFIQCWATLYIGMPESMLVDNGSVFISEEWAYACEVNSIELRVTGIESHNSLSAGETYHSYLRRCYNKLRSDFPKLSDELLLALAIKAINDSAGPSGLVPSLLVFGTMPRKTTKPPRPYPDQRERLRAAATARQEYERIVTSERVRMASNRKPSPSSNDSYAPGDLAYVYRENLRRYTGPHMVASSDEKQVRLHVGDRRGPRAFNLAQLRRAPLPNAYAEHLAEPRYVHQLLHTEIVKKGDPREKWFDEAKQKEILGLIERGTFKIVVREDAGPHPNILPSRYVLAIKHTQDGTTKLKARFVVGGHRDRNKRLMVHNSPTLRPESFRTLIALATILGLDLTICDWTQGYIQSKSELLRRVFIKPSELQLSSNELVQLMRPLYGLTESGDYFHETLRRHLHDHLSFQQSDIDMAFWFHRVAGKLIALAGTYVDDVLLASNKTAFESFKTVSSWRFDVKFDSSALLLYLGIRIDSSNRDCRTISQPRQIDRQKVLKLTCSFSEYRKSRAGVAWMIQTRPDVACAISFAARTTEDNFDTSDVVKHNKLVLHLRNTRGLTLKFPRLDSESLRICCFVDAGYFNKQKGDAQLGYLICLCDAKNRCNIIEFSSRKAKRVARSTTTAEALALSHGYDATFTLQHTLQKVLHKTIPLLILLDSEILFNSITRRKIPAEKRLMVDLLAVRQGFDRKEITNIALISSESNPADALTKLKPNGSLERLMRTGKIDCVVNQYIITPNPRTSSQPPAKKKGGNVGATAPCTLPSVTRSADDSHSY